MLDIVELQDQLEAEGVSIDKVLIFEGSLRVVRTFKEEPLIASITQSTDQVYIAIHPKFWADDLSLAETFGRAIQEAVYPNMTLAELCDCDDCLEQQRKDWAASQGITMTA